MEYADETPRYTGRDAEQCTARFKHLLERIGFWDGRMSSYHRRLFLYEPQQDVPEGTRMAFTQYYSHWPLASRVQLVQHLGGFDSVFMLLHLAYLKKGESAPYRLRDGVFAPRIAGSGTGRSGNLGVGISGLGGRSNGGGIANDYGGRYNFGGNIQGGIRNPSSSGNIQGRMRDPSSSGNTQGGMRSQRPSGRGPGQQNEGESYYQPTRAPRANTVVQTKFRD